MLVDEHLALRLGAFGAHPVPVGLTQRRELCLAGGGQPFQIVLGGPEYAEIAQWRDRILLRTIAGLEEPSEGEVRIDGQVVNDLPPRARKPGSVGVAAGPDIAIMDEAGALLKAGELGEIVIRGRNVTRGYEANPEANAKAFSNGWFRTGDQGVIDEAGYLRLTGRLKELINRGGEKISPLEVDTVIMDHPAVARGVNYLKATQEGDGLWSQAHYTGGGFPRVFYLNYHGYPKFFPLWALARYRNLKAGNSRRVEFGL